MKFLNINPILTSCLLCGAFTVALAQNSPVQRKLPSQSAQRLGIPHLPAPSGPFGIGRMGYEWIDTSRPDGHSADPQAHRDLMVYLWYPAPKAEFGKAGLYLPGATEMDVIPVIQSAMREEFEGNWSLIVSGAISSHDIEGAPVAETPGTFPVVIFVHGLGCTCFEYTSLIEDLVSRGYVVAAIEDTYMAAAVAFPHGRIIPADHEPAPAGLSPEQGFQRMVKMAELQINTGAGDMVFVLNKLIQLNHGNAQSFALGGRLDMGRVAAMGHSAGGAIAAQACQLDGRFKACLSLEGEMPPVAAFPERPNGVMFTQPVLLLEVDKGGRKWVGFNAPQNEKYLKKREEQLNKCPTGSYDVLLKSPGLTHGSFSDYPLLSASGHSPETEVALHNLRLTQSFILAFLEKNLNHAKEPLLDGVPNPPEGSVRRYGR